MSCEDKGEDSIGVETKICTSLVVLNADVQIILLRPWLEVF